MSDSLPILYIKVQSLVLQENAKAMHKACAAFIASKNDERIKRTLLFNVRTISEVRYITGDTVLY